MSQNINNIMNDTVDKIRSMASVDTIIGDPVDLGDGIKAIPVSKVSYGFASAGSDIPTAKTSKDVFGGGGGAGARADADGASAVQKARIHRGQTDPRLRIKRNRREDPHGGAAGACGDAAARRDRRCDIRRKADDFFSGDAGTAAPVSLLPAGFRFGAI